MPLRLPDGLPAIDILKRENINIEDMLTKEEDKRAIRIVILNLMPFKSTTETDFIRLLSNSPLLLDISFLKLKSHTSKHTPEEHMNRFYHTLEEVSKEKIDGLIVTGAPVEDLPFEEVDSTLYICWAAQAGLYHFYDIPKYPLPKKMFGIFPTIPLKPELSLFRGFDDVFRMPQSRHTEVRREDIEQVDDLEIIAESEESGVSIVRSRSKREFFITGHLEYAPNTLDTEYRRDLGKRDDVELPKYYYREDNPEKGPLVTWRAHANLLFTNWVMGVR